MDKEQLNAMAQRMKQKRKSLGLTQIQAADMLEISYSTYTKIENGFHSPSLDTAINISMLLKMSLDELVFGRDESFDENSAETLALIVALKSCDKEKLAYAVEMFEKIVSCL